MHEYGIARSILSAVLEKCPAGKKITGVKLRVGEMKMVTRESLQGAFEIVANDTTAETARLDMELVPGDELTVLEAEIEE